MQNLVRHIGRVTHEDRCKTNGHKSGVLWFTGLSASGKSTLAYALEKMLHENGISAYVLDGDNIRHDLCKGLGFSAKDRTENLRRAAEVARLMSDAGLIVLASFITPERAQRRMIRELVAPIPFAEVYIKCNLEECINRDPKGHYRKARAGQIAQYTGLGAPYEPPESPDITIDTACHTINQSTAALYHFLQKTL